MFWEVLSQSSPKKASSIKHHFLHSRHHLLAQQIYFTTAE